MDYFVCHCTSFMVFILNETLEKYFLAIRERKKYCSTDAMMFEGQVPSRSYNKCTALVATEFIHHGFYFV